jgi:large subunit ribosomal protein L24
MATKWNRGWSGSVQVRKQRAYVREAPLHAKGDFVSAHLQKDLRQKYKCRSIRLRAGDKVKIMRGSFKNKTGKVDRINVKEQKVYITGIEFTKRDGSKAMYPIHPSNIIIQEPDTSDKRRFAEKKQ